MSSVVARSKDGNLGVSGEALVDAGIRKRRQHVLSVPEDLTHRLDLEALVEVSVADMEEGVVGSEADSVVIVEVIVDSADVVASDTKADVAGLVVNPMDLAAVNHL